MARLPRYFAKGQPQHIIQRGNNREPIFAATEDYQFYLSCLKQAAKEHQLKIHAYVLMTNHVHLLVTPESADSLPKTLQSVGRRYVGYFNYTYKRTGTLWEGRYKATVIDSEAYLMTCMRYIESNPIRAAMVESLSRYPWSSYGVNALGHTNVMVWHHDLYQRLGPTMKKRQYAYQQYLRLPCQETI